MSEAKPEAEVLCWNRAYHCACVLEKEHEGDHLCDCGGKWTFNEQGKFRPTRLPLVRGTDRPGDEVIPNV